MVWLQNESTAYLFCFAFKVFCGFDQVKEGFKKSRPPRTDNIYLKVID